MALTNDICELHKRHIRISLGINFKRRADGSKWSEHNKQTNAIHFKCKSHDVTRALKYFKQTYPSKMTAVQAEKSLG